MEEGFDGTRYDNVLLPYLDSERESCLDAESPRRGGGAAAAHEDYEPIFRSHVCGMFEDDQSSRTDACAVFCCGIYLWQRNRDILVREQKISGDDFADEDSPIIATLSSSIEDKPLGTFFLLLVAITVVLWFFDADILSTAVGSSCLSLMIGIAWKKYVRFRKARQKLRGHLGVAEYYRRRGNSSNHPGEGMENDPGLVAFLEEHKHELFQGHSFVECVSSRIRSIESCFGPRTSSTTTATTSPDNNGRDIQEDEDDENRSPKGFCQGSWRFLDNVCCGMLFGCNLQLFGMCAIAQESRHLRETIPTEKRPGLWQRDYITMQPWMDYYPSILRLRLSNQIHCVPHFKALSRLSRRILIASASILLFVTLMFLLPIRFPKWQILILYGTLLQPAVFLFFVHWLWNRLDISVDAVVKYFACGFFICTSSAIVYEWLVSKLAEKFIVLLDRLGTEGLVLFGNDSNQRPHEGHTSSIVRPLWYHFTKALLIAFVNAFFVAGLTEELCKYLCFWMVEHPDLEIANRVVLSPSCVQSESDRQSGNSDRENSETTRLLSRNPITSIAPSDSKEQPVFAPIASLVSLGEAITVAMVTLALGFACAENFLYIFVYTTPGFREEIGTLYVRCLFPIHPMTAALQSIGVCRRDLEKDSSVGIGKILLPAWLLHGLFDFSLMAYSTIKEILSRHQRFEEGYGPSSTDPPRMEPGGGNPVSVDQGQPILMYVMFVPFVAMMYFLNESFYQRERLEKLDRENRVRT